MGPELQPEDGPGARQNDDVQTAGPGGTTNIRADTYEARTVVGEPHGKHPHRGEVDYLRLRTAACRACP